ncbi:FeoC-like transcriptional regulator [Vibrio sp.]|uniref:Iron transporter FeoC n=1 Tax=Vibrio viridaestus TaxID=2487322 RepID=A0A3N9U7J4_9VIBR|nr:FeoC-like transcriptional regulator [Vibrio viridaestus]MDC0611720.1 FeoC-like transcriptional regulator [Vibrio sp.]RQW64146.1 iron transporter FeoC [Vibrio viridaestus]
MILHELRNYIAEKGMVTRNELAKRFALSEDGVDAMLEVWLKKGVICRYADTNLKNHVSRVRYSINERESIPMNVIL